MAVTCPMWKTFTMPFQLFIACRNGCLRTIDRGAHERPEYAPCVGGNFGLSHPTRRASIKNLEPVFSTPLPQRLFGRFGFKCIPEFQGTFALE